jgi:hypothetical protein
VVGSPPQDSSTARHAIGIVAIAIDLPEIVRTRFPGPREQKATRSGMDDPGGW